MQPTDSLSSQKSPSVATNQPAKSKKSFVNTKFMILAAIGFLCMSVFAMSFIIQNRTFTTQDHAASASCVLRDSNIVVVIDRSSSMNSKEADGRTKLEWAKESAKTLVDRIAAMPGTNAKIGVASFGAQGNDGSGKLDSSYNSTLDIALSSNYNDVKTAISNIQQVKSGTCIECGLKIANRQLTAQAQNKIVILLSDGKANHNWAGDSANSAGAVAEANSGRSSGIVYYVLGYGTGSGIDEGTLKSIAGKDANYQYKPNAQEWPDAFLTIVDIICSQPTPTPTNTPTPTKTPTPLPTNTPTPKPSNTPTPTPTKTPTPVPSSTTTPSPTPTPTLCVTPKAVTDLKISCPLCQ